MSASRWCLMLTVVLSLGVAHGEAPMAAAKRLYQSGSHHFDLQEYAAALADFKAAYDLKDDPVFLFNIAQCQRFLEQREQAIRSYKIYLTRAPNARNRADVESRIATMQEELEAQKAKAEVDRRQAEAKQASLVTPPVEVVSQAPPPRPTHKRAWVWGVVAGGVVVVGVALGLGLGLGLHSGHAQPVGSPVQF